MDANRILQSAPQWHYERWDGELLSGSLGDALPAAEFQAFLLAVFASYRTAVEPTAGLYVCHPSSAQREFQTAIEAAGFAVRTQIIWASAGFQEILLPLRQLDQSVSEFFHAFIPLF